MGHIFQLVLSTSWVLVSTGFSGPMITNRGKKLDLLATWPGLLKREICAWFGGKTVMFFGLKKNWWSWWRKSAKKLMMNHLMISMRMLQITSNSPGMSISLIITNPGSPPLANMIMISKQDGYDLMPKKRQNLSNNDFDIILAGSYYFCH